MFGKVPAQPLVYQSAFLAVKKLKERVIKSDGFNGESRHQLACEIYRLAYALESDRDDWQKFCAPELWDGKSSKPRISEESKRRSIFFTIRFVFPVPKSTAGEAISRRLAKAKKNGVAPAKIESWIAEYENARKAKLAKGAETRRKKKEADKKVLDEIADIIREHNGTAILKFVLHRQKESDDSYARWNLVYRPAT